MEVRVEESNQPDFPGLFAGKNTGAIVLMSEPGIGTLLNHDLGFKPGYSSTRWVMDNFTVFHGKVVISNKETNG